MASIYADQEFAENLHYEYPLQQPQQQRQARSPRTPTSASVYGATPKCVCSPTTHPGSFKCRFHRLHPQSDENHHQPPPPPPQAAAPQPPRATPPRPNRVVEAQ